jgi:L-arabinose isomerase
MAWPRYDYDVGGMVDELLSECSSWCVDDCEFVIKKWVKSEEDLEEILRRSNEFDGVVIYMLTTGLKYVLLYSVVRKLADFLPALKDEGSR